MKVALLEDDQAQAKLLNQWLTEEGYQVLHRGTVTDFISLLQAEPVDMALLDWQLPDGSGLDALGWIRDHNQASLPVIFSTQRDSEEDVVEALKAGADDYMIKPPRRAELIARLAAISRRAGLDKLHSPQLQLAHITIDQDAQKVWVHEQEVKLTRKDFLLACCVIKNQGKLLSREYLLKEVWGVAADINTRTVDMHISRMRRNLQLEPSCGYCIKTVYQHGYRLEKVDD
ncbi:response regulator transcription factor [Halioxenophilus sp. WMMB6]|uniref:response regulator transcription factor n=1 Tax=Halioxenophilus sp. WMMB6 TaxID=3073815 RepID=UPI00295E3B1D|nr:response regulator transcription factor [Halioxenophilus sp. WMMB6]